MSEQGTANSDLRSKALEYFQKSYNSKNLAVRRMKVEELDLAILLLRAKIPAARASDDAIYRVQRRNPDSIWGIYRRGEENTPGAEILGFFCMLLLTEEGARLVRADQFNTREPDVNLLVRPGERPFAIYYWAIVAEASQFQPVQ